MVPGSTLMLMWSLARTPPKRLVMSLSSNITRGGPSAPLGPLRLRGPIAPRRYATLLEHRIDHLYFSGNDLSLRLFSGGDRLGRHKVSVVLVNDVSDAVAFEPEDVKARLEALLCHVLH